MNIEGTDVYRKVIKSFALKNMYSKSPHKRNSPISLEVPLFPLNYDGFFRRFWRVIAFKINQKKHKNDTFHLQYAKHFRASRECREIKN